MTNYEKIKIKEIQKKLEQLSQKRVELSKSHQQQFFLYRWLQGPDPELQSVKDEIEDLKEQRRRLYDILQAAASIPPPVPEKDWSKNENRKETWTSPFLVLEEE
jgi:aminoglycoside phosphotransferase (APT) family kinase protein